MSRLSPEEATSRILEEAEREPFFRISFPDYSLRWIFERAAKTSPGTPTALQKDFAATIDDKIISVYAPYRVENGTHVLIEGRARAGPRGLLASEQFTVTPEELTQEIVQKIGGEADFVRFLELTLREAFPRLMPERLWLRDNKLYGLFGRVQH